MDHETGRKDLREAADDKQEEEMRAGRGKLCPRHRPQAERHKDCERCCEDETRRRRAPYTQPVA